MFSIQVVRYVIICFCMTLLSLKSTEKSADLSLSHRKKDFSVPFKERGSNTK